MTFANSDIARSAVKLYPRLATTDPQLELKLAARAVRRERRNASDNDPGNAANAQVRARLLRMIMENERVRRHEHRPNAS